MEQERSRIAQDIHDDLGANLTRISLICQSAQGKSVSVDGGVRAIDDIYATTHELTRQMDEIVWAVSPRHDSVESLVDYMRLFAQDFLGVAGIRCRLDFPTQIPPLPISSGTRHGLFLDAKKL